MGRQRLNKFKDMREANRLFENRYENQNKTIRTEQQLGDGTGDGYVDQQDVDYVTNNWLQPGDVYDSNDGIINLSDLSLTTANFGQGSPPESLPTGPCWLTYADSTVGGYWNNNWFNNWFNNWNNNWNNRSSYMLWV